MNLRFQRFPQWVTVLLVALMLVPALASAHPGESGRADNMRVTATAKPATAKEAQDLRFLREEEKLARDVYLFLYGKWQLRD